MLIEVKNEKTNRRQDVSFEKGMCRPCPIEFVKEKRNWEFQRPEWCPLREVYMANARRKTTLDERKEIVKYCLNHDRDYKGAAEKYDVSYSQVYSWVKKYDVIGEEGLTDRRGRRKSDDEVDELERLKRENLRLKRQLEERDMLVELLKKVKEFERM